MVDNKTSATTSYRNQDNNLVEVVTMDKPRNVTVGLRSSKSPSTAKMRSPRSRSQEKVRSPRSRSPENVKAPRSSTATDKPAFKFPDKKGVTRHRPSRSILDGSLFPSRKTTLSPTAAASRPSNTTPTPNAAAAVVVVAPNGDKKEDVDPSPSLSTEKDDDDADDTRNSKPPLYVGGDVGGDVSTVSDLRSPPSWVARPQRTRNGHERGTTCDEEHRDASCPSDRGAADDATTTRLSTVDEEQRSSVATTRPSPLCEDRPSSSLSPRDGVPNASRPQCRACGSPLPSDAAAARAENAPPTSDTDRDVLEDPEIRRDAADHFVSCLVFTSMSFFFLLFVGTVVGAVFLIGAFGVVGGVAVAAVVGLLSGTLYAAWRLIHQEPKYRRVKDRMLQWRGVAKAVVLQELTAIRDEMREHYLLTNGPARDVDGDRYAAMNDNNDDDAERGISSATPGANGRSRKKRRSFLLKMIGLPFGGGGDKRSTARNGNNRSRGKKKIFKRRSSKKKSIPEQQQQQQEEDVQQPQHVDDNDTMYVPPIV